ncbi:trna wybutosine-synthesizing protein [Ophiostoma piceae UAMH 11346]|uniref:tRNA(Phe) (4-demethylwyosine(37)-C(7)) aminocarboxypropyltransferase n=1 Tax=Ophiostoma piceae (strain UAMH 11346) TaxID=1262450 RepID=S3C726_OPHP1|nr:trna wybutosine-synthesizing protein [Ophiostoma piceae UAMH 11346]
MVFDTDGAGQAVTSKIEVGGDVEHKVDGDMKAETSLQTHTQLPSGHPRNGVPKAQLQKRPKKPKAENRLASVIRRWLNDVLPALDGQAATVETIDTLVSQAPKRWVIYEPMVLLPTGSFGFTCVPGQAAASSEDLANVTWQSVLSSASEEQKSLLWTETLAVLSPGTGPSSQLTHLAVNEGIPLHVAGGHDASKDAASTEENILRSPTGLRPLHGDFGPATAALPGREDDPSDEDLAAAFWVSTKQNGLYQTWAPRWSMFSRGNIKEKARLLAWPGNDLAGSRLAIGGKGGKETKETKGTKGTKEKKVEKATAVDLYAGIGYFVFSYAQRGLRVLGWELNPWSTEALRRGAVRNGWSVKIVRGTDLALPTTEVIGDESIVIFVEDNQRAAQRLAELRGAEMAPLRVTHVNGGLLPTSRPIWRTAWDAVVDSARDAREARDSKDARDAKEADADKNGEKYTGWLHLHDNVGVDELDSRKAEIQALVDAWGAAAGDGLEAVSVVEHTELVKTFAPGVWHCVFDVRVECSLE